MECNRDEAIRAKDIAEIKFNSKDVAGAKKFALKAQNLFPGLEGISQMISTLDVYLAAQSKINGESDWYAILCVNASADEDSLKKQYRKLALQLHPDKNKSVGAEGAFKLISEAWSVLSDKTRKMAYDQKRNVKGPHQHKTLKRDNAASNTNGFYNFANSKTSAGRSQKSTNNAASGAANSTHKQKLDTFWTSCNRCRMQYEYLRVYLNHNLLCPNCNKAFYAVETGIPTNGTSQAVKWSASQQNQQNTGHQSTTTGHNNSSFQWGPFSRSAGTATATTSSSAAAQAANVVHHTYEKVRREREDAQAAAKREEALRRRNYASKQAADPGNLNAFPDVDRPDKKRRRSITDDYVNAYSRNETECADRTAQGMGKSYVGAFMTEKVNGSYADFVKTGVVSRLNGLNKEFALLNVRNLLIERSKKEIRNKLEEWKTAEAAKFATKEKAKKQRDNDNRKAPDVAFDASGEGKLGVASNTSQNLHGTKNPSDDRNSDSDKEIAHAVSIDVPDSDFHDFDKDRSERSFDGDQVWASYDNEDGMPRFYVLIQKVISYKPFKIRMSFLNSKTNNEFGPLKWVSSGFVKTCGEFRVSRYETSDTINIFSHKVRWDKGPRGVIRVFPCKGETWAVYKNWSPEWNERTSDDVIYKYDMVEVLEDYNEEEGISVTPLVKVAGFKTVFHRHLDQNEVRRIPREEMFRFSHQVPSHLLTGEEADNAPKGCRELDPAATPVELLQVMMEVKEDEEMETAEEQAVG